MTEKIDLTEDVEQAKELLGLLQSIQGAYEDLPKINLEEDIDEAKELLRLLQGIRQEIEEMPDLPET